ncbi:MAG: HAD family phosphatase [Rubritepida sp.]|nr:HAD family phosphatase [Rubritepida sp.]
MTTGRAANRGAALLTGIRAVLFDCDGVLADSEGPVNAIVAEELTARGWPMDAHAAEREFLGLALPDMLPRIVARVGPLPPDWPMALSARIQRELVERLQPIPGAVAAVGRVAALGLPMAVCSNSAREELRMKLGVLGLSGFFGDRVFSFQDVARPKPAPDLYLAAAAACGVPPGECLVVEDSAPGIVAGLAAGCRVVSVVEGLGVPVVGMDALG